MPAEPATSAGGSAASESDLRWRARTVVRTFVAADRSHRPGSGLRRTPWRRNERLARTPPSMPARCSGASRRPLPGLRSETSAAVAGPTSRQTAGLSAPLGGPARSARPRRPLPCRLARFHERFGNLPAAPWAATALRRDSALVNTAGTARSTNSSPSKHASSSSAISGYASSSFRRSGPLPCR